MHRFLPILLLVTAVCTTAAVASDWTLEPYGDLRVRQEKLDGVYHFDAANPDRDWIRVRTRVGAGFTAAGHELDVRLANEHRHYLDPDDVDFDWDELVVDRAAWTWRPDDGTSLTVGRQDIIWPGGFLMLEGHPLDGSRSIWHNAVRARVARGWGELDVALIHNPRQDDFVLIDDEDRNLTNGKETGLAGRWSRGPWSAAAIWKREDLDGDRHDLETVTASGRWFTRQGDGSGWEGEFAVQHQMWGDDPALPDGPDWTPGEDGWALAGHGAYTHALGGGRTLSAGGFYYSGDGEHLSAFRAPWGSWPKWSELYIYTLIAEGTPQRVHVAAWQNIAAPRVELRSPLGSLAGRKLAGRLAAAALLAPADSFDGRGLLTQAELTCDLGHGLKSHLLWEMLDPGDFHEATMDDPVHFLRWQITYAIR